MKLLSVYYYYVAIKCLLLLGAILDSLQILASLMLMTTL